MALALDLFTIFHLVTAFHPFNFASDWISNDHGRSVNSILRRSGSITAMWRKIWYTLHACSSRFGDFFFFFSSSFSRAFVHLSLRHSIQVWMIMIKKFHDNTTSQYEMASGLIVPVRLWQYRSSTVSISLKFTINASTSIVLLSSTDAY